MKGQGKDELKTDTQIEIWYGKPTKEEMSVEGKDRLGIFPLKDGVLWVLASSVLFTGKSTKAISRYMTHHRSE